MGGGQSATPTAQEGSTTPTGTGYPHNNNTGDIVVIPVDASKQAETAFLWYVKHVHRPENEVRVVHCQEMTYTPILNESANRTEAWDEMVNRAKKQSNDIMSKYEKKLEEHKLKGTLEDVTGKPGEMVIKAVEKNNATMVVMGTRGYGILRRTILGSVSEYVIHHSKVPVTVIPVETTHWFY